MAGAPRLAMRSSGAHQFNRMEVKMNVEQSASEYEIKHELQFVDTEHGFRYIEINNAKAQATLSTDCGQVLFYRRVTEQENVRFVSARAARRTDLAGSGRSV